MTVSDCKRQGADQPSTRAGWSVPLFFTTMSVLKHFVDVHYSIVSIFVRFLLYVVYVFVLCSPYLEDNKVSIYLFCCLLFCFRINILNKSGIIPSACQTVLT